MKIRTAHKAITSIYIENGVKLTEPKEVEAEFVSFFTLILIQIVSVEVKGSVYIVV